MKALMFILPVVIAGAVLGLGFAGVVNIPGITPKKAAPKVRDNPETAKKDEAPAPSTSKKAAEATPDPLKGYVAVAKLWNDFPLEKMEKVSAKWKDDELAQILRKMDQDKVVQFLGKIDEARAAKLTRKIQDLAALDAG